MQQAFGNKLTRKSFFFSLIIHLFLLLFLLKISTIFNVETLIPQKSPELYIPSYVYKGSIAPPVAPQRISTPSQSSQNIEPAQNKPSPLASTNTKSFFKEKSILNMSRNMIQQNQMDTALNRLNQQEPPILLIGDKHTIVDPLIKLLGRALSAHFHYPKIEGIFGARGRVYVELVLHPEGYFSDVRIIQSSEIEDFNAAALYAVNTAPTVVGANKFLPKPQRFVVGFVFE